LEVGLGYGTLGQFIASKGAQYFGVDIAEGPVMMMRHRMRMLGQPEHQIEQGSVLELAHADASFDFVYSIGVLHHTGNLPRSIEQVYRVLRPGGKAIIMLYNRQSFRQFLLTSKRRFQPDPEQTFKQSVRAAYDSNAKGEAAPHTDYVTRAEVRQLFKQFANVHIDTQNFDDYSLLRGHLFISRKLFLNNLARLVGLDLYIVAQK
jgi:SAM-dependent methyltransferase